MIQRNFMWALALILLSTLRLSLAIDELLSARCQAKCLSDFEKVAHDRMQNRRQLKHNIIPFCKDDLNCSSCAIPCREHYENLEQCKSFSCKDAQSREFCEKSCEFLEQVYTKKPGRCRKPKITDSAECVISCRRDGDCLLTEKCCSNGCGQSCSLPRGLRKRLLPIPSAVTVQERKRGRSAIVRWVMTMLKPEHVKTHANLFVIQWRWGVKKNEEDMNNWQTITIRNKLYAILKHLLSPGRYYRFRVAAVNKHGSQGFSESSPVFKLSKSPKAPGKPRKLEVGSVKLESDGRISQEIHWLPPTSDLPIVHYQVTWVEEDAVNATSTLPPRSDLLNDMPGTQQALKSVEESQDFMSSGLRKTELIPAARNSLHLRDLKAGAKYRIEVQAIVEGEGSEEIMGDTASLMIFTTSFGSIDETSAENISEEKSETTEEDENIEAIKSTDASADYPEVTGLLVHKPFFQNGLLKAVVDWNVDNEGETREEYKFEVSWSPVVCLGETSTGIGGRKPLIAHTSANTFHLYDLQFGCHYTANVSTVFLKGDSAYARVPGQSVLFETPSCHNTPVRGTVSPDCPTLPPNAPTKPRSLNCRNEVSKRSVTAICSWKAPARSDKPVQGYRVLTGRKLSHNYGIGNSDPFPSIDQNTASIEFIEDGSSEIRLEQLLADTEYVIQVQAYSDVGHGPSIYRTFSTPSSLKKPKNEPLDEKEKATMVYKTEEEERIVIELDSSGGEERSSQTSRGNKKTSGTSSSATSNHNFFSILNFGVFLFLVKALNHGAYLFSISSLL